MRVAGSVVQRAKLNVGPFLRTATIAPYYETVAATMALIKRRAGTARPTIALRRNNALLKLDRQSQEKGGVDTDRYTEEMLGRRQRVGEQSSCDHCHFSRLLPAVRLVDGVNGIWYEKPPERLCQPP